MKKQVSKYEDNHMKTCLVVGYINNNLGDDLFFKILFDRYPNVKFYFYPPSVQLQKYKDIYIKNKNVIFYDEEEYYVKIRKDIPDVNVPINLFPMICERAKNVDCLIIIGGSIFSQNDDWKNDDRFTLKKIIGKKPSFIVGCNFGPGDSEFYEYYKQWFKKFDDICFRDNNSYNQFNDLKNARKADDIILIDKKRFSIPILRKRKSVGFSIIDISRKKEIAKYKDDYYRFLRKAIIYYQQKNYKINLFSFCKNEGDLEAINELLNYLPNKNNINIIEYDNNINKFISQWKKTTYIIGTRFHATILALKYNQKFIPIIYSDKTSNYLKDLDPKIRYYEMRDLKRVKMKNLNYNYINKVYNSKIHFLKIDEYLKK